MREREREREKVIDIYSERAVAIVHSYSREIKGQVRPGGET